jgi:hypothetical protein
MQLWKTQMRICTTVTLAEVSERINESGDITADSYNNLNRWKSSFSLLTVQLHKLINFIWKNKEL